MEGRIRDDQGPSGVVVGIPNQVKYRNFLFNEKHLEQATLSGAWLAVVPDISIAWILRPKSYGSSSIFAFDWIQWVSIPYAAGVETISQWSICCNAVRADSMCHNPCTLEMCYGLIPLRGRNKVNLSMQIKPS